MENIARKTPVKTSMTSVTPCRPAEVICSVLVPMACWRFLAIWLICCSVTWNGELSSQRFNCPMPSWTWSESWSMLSITCQTTNQPTRPMSTKPPMNVIGGGQRRAARRPACSRATVGWSSAVISRAATKASTTSAPR